MIFAEYDYDVDLAVQRAEERRIEQIKIARNLLSMQLPESQVAQGTGLPLETVHSLAKEQ